MKTLNVFAILIASLVTQAANAGVIEAHLKNIQDRIRACVILPYTVKNERKVYHALISHCPEVQVFSKGKAQIKVGGSTYQAVLVATENTDGDFYDVVIREPISNDRYRMTNVLAYGDVLLGILAGESLGLREVKYVGRVGGGLLE